jgi:integrase/recombinase XerD
MVSTKPGQLQVEGSFRGFPFHDLRHLYAVEKLRAGRGLCDLSKHVGHTSVKTTEIYLAFLTPGQAEAAKSASAQNAAQPNGLDGG